MSVRRLIVLIVFCFLLFLGIYTWNARTGKWDALGANVGLEVSSLVLRAVTFVHDTISEAWNRYIYLVDVEAENEVLKKEIADLKLSVAKFSESSHELQRMRRLLHFKNPASWQSIGARVFAWQLGSNDFLESLVISKGFNNGAKVATPLITPDGLVGRVYKAGPFTAIALLLTDPGSSIAVFTSENRVPAIVQGAGINEYLNVSFVKQNVTVSVGEILITSGVDLSYPKGIPVGRVVSVEHGADAMLKIKAEPLVSFENVEEVLLLQNPYEEILPQGSPVYSPRESQFLIPTDKTLEVPEPQPEMDLSNTLEQIDLLNQDILTSPNIIEGNEGNEGIDGDDIPEEQALLHRQNVPNITGLSLVLHAIALPLPTKIKVSLS